MEPWTNEFNSYVSHGDEVSIIAEELTGWELIMPGSRNREAVQSTSEFGFDI